MKFCPHCGRYFRDSVSACPDDGMPLDNVAPVFTFQPFEGGRKRNATTDSAERPTAAEQVSVERTGHGPSMFDTADPRFGNADTPHFADISDPVPPHDDWETWGGRPSDFIRFSDDGVGGPRKAGREAVPVQTRESLKSQIVELAAAAFGFGMLGFLLHLLGMSTVKPSHPSTVASTSPPSQVSRTTPALAPVVSGAIPAPAETAVRPKVSSFGSRLPRPEVKIVEIGRSGAGAHRTSPAHIRHSPDSVVARGSTPVARRPARVRGIPLSTARRPQILVAKNASTAAVRAPSRVPDHRVREARNTPAKANVEVAAKRRRPEKLARAAVRRSTPRRPQVARNPASSPARIRLARSFEERRSTPLPAHPRRTFSPVRVAALPQDELRGRSPRSIGDPDEEVIGLSAALSQDRSRPSSARGPFGLSIGSGDRHVVYVVDASPGMSAHWRQAISEVVSSIRSLGPDDTFDVVTFNRRARAFSSTLMPAMPGTEASVIDYLKYVRIAGGANLQDALWVALRLPDVNEVVIVMGGVPTAGEINPRRLAEFVSSANHDGIRIDTVGLVNPNSYSSFDRARAGELLRQIARDSGGDARLVTLD